MTWLKLLPLVPSVTRRYAGNSAFSSLCNPSRLASYRVVQALNRLGGSEAHTLETLANDQVEAVAQEAKNCLK